MTEFFRVRSRPPLSMGKGELSLKFDPLAQQAYDLAFMIPFELHRAPPS